MKVEFHLYNSLFHLPFTDIVAPTGLLSWLACCLPRDKKNRSCWPQRTEAYQDTFLDVDCQKRGICMHPKWLQRSMPHPSLPCSSAVTCHIFIIDHCFLFPGYLYTSMQPPSLCSFQEIKAVDSWQPSLMRLYGRHIGVISLDPLVFRERKVKEIYGSVFFANCAGYLSKLFCSTTNEICSILVF